MSDGTTTWNYTYDANGMRTSRSNGSKTYNYVYNGSQLTQMTVGSDTLYFTYGILGPTTVTWNGTTYYYALNGQGDVTGIFDEYGVLVVSYNWDNAWGYNPIPEGVMASTLGALNPLRYRGYVYDSETGYYYLQSRYYDPEIGRFINADTLVSTGQGFLGNNMFAYCLNNPANFVDRSGNNAEVVQWWTVGMSWLPLADTILPIGDIIYGAGIVVLGLCTLDVVDEIIPTTTTISTEGKESPIMEYSEHKKGARQSTKGKHEKGQTRKERDNRGEKGDKRRVYLGNKKKFMMFSLLADDLFAEDCGSTDCSLFWVPDMQDILVTWREIYII